MYIETLSIINGVSRKTSYGSYFADTDHRKMNKPGHNRLEQETIIELNMSEGAGSNLHVYVECIKRKDFSHVRAITANAQEICGCIDPVCTQ